MNSTFSTIGKELLLLVRDKTGLAVLFLMPMVLVLIMSLVQNNILNNTGIGIEVLFVNQDRGDAGQSLEKELRERAQYTLVTEVGGTLLTATKAERLVNRGYYSIGIVVPENLTDVLNTHAVQFARNAITLTTENDHSGSPLSMAFEHTELTVFFDPAAQGTLRSAVLSNLDRILGLLELDHEIAALNHIIPERFREIVLQVVRSQNRRDLSPQTTPQDLHVPEVELRWSRQTAVSVNPETSSAPTAVQQNVPAWTLFGMFFIVIPLGEALLRERDNGTLSRLLVMPTPYVNILAGKIIAYMIVCLIQCALMILVGLLLLPRFGTPVLELGDSPAALLIMALSSAMAAVGFGILVGTCAHSYRQASMFGPLAVVIAAAIGGIMVPVYVMPDPMKELTVISPLSWGLTGFLDVFVRGGTLVSVLPEILKLTAFSVLCVFSAWAVFSWRQHE